jgi:hypothetical protein
VTIQFNGKIAELPVNQNTLKIGQHLYSLEGVVVHAPKTDRAYIPQQAVNAIRGSKSALPRIAR